MHSARNVQQGDRTSDLHQEPTGSLRDDTDEKRPFRTTSLGS